MPVSLSFPVERNVNDEECLPLVWVLKGCTSLSFMFEMMFKRTENAVAVMAGNFPVTIRNEFRRNVEVSF